MAVAQEWCSGGGLVVCAGTPWNARPCQLGEAPSAVPPRRNLRCRRGASPADSAPSRLTCASPRRRLAVAGDDAQVRVFDSQTKELRHTMAGHSEAAQCCAFDRKGKFLVTGGSDATMRMWC